MTKKQTLNCIIFPLKNPIKLLEKLGVDKYTKKLTTEKFISLMIYAQINESESMRSVAIDLDSSMGLQNAIGLESISHSQLSRKLCELNPEKLNSVFLDVVKQVQASFLFKKAPATLNRLCLIDSSTISMSFTQYKWADFRKTKAGIKLHQRLIFANGIELPDKAIITVARPADKNQMDNLVSEEPGDINVFDRAYVVYTKFDDYSERGIKFVTRLKSNALIELIERKDVVKESVVLSDEIVILGKGSTKMKHKVRIIKTVDLNNKPLTILTNVFDKTAEEIAEIYRHRWKIELFFKWIKQHCKIKEFYGKSANAVENQIYFALITYCLLMLVKLKEKYSGTLLTCLRIIKVNLLNNYVECLRKLKKRVSKTSYGRRRIDDEKVFDSILSDFEEGNTITYSAY